MKKKRSNAHPRVNLGKEVATFTQQLVAAIKTSVTSPEAKAVGREALKGIRATGNRLTAALKKAQEAQETRKARHQAHRLVVIGKHRTQGATQNVRKNLSISLENVARELRRLRKKIVR